MGSDDNSDDLAGWRRLLPVTFAVALALALGLLFFFAKHAAFERDDALSLQRHSYEVIALARNAEGSSARAESLLARYVVSLDANDGRRYSDEWRQAGVLIDTLRRATRDDPVQRQNIQRLQIAYADRGVVLNDIALRTTYDQRVGALGRLYAANKTHDADLIQSLLEDTTAREFALLNLRSGFVDRAEVRVGQLLTSYTLVGGILLAAAFLALWLAGSAASERRFAARMAAAEAQRVDDLEIAVNDRTQELEVSNARLLTEMEERAQAEESLRQLHKMEAIGQLTGGIAHDFNNMLAVVVGGLELARRRVGEDSEAMRHIDNALEGANRASSLTRRLLAFARAEPMLPGAIDADLLVNGMADLIDRTIGDQIEVVIEPGAGAWRLWADRHQLENALINLCVNARDAMDGRGRLIVATQRVALAANEINDSAAGDYVRLSVSDTGRGMTPEVLARVFEPFFTTKPVGKGTGLGLSQVFGYIGQCDGQIRIRSTPGEGTEVEIFLPRSLRGENVEPARTGFDTSAATAPRRAILVVEDDPRVLATTLAALGELGHRCAACAHPLEAAEALAAHPETEIVLTDVLMPEMSGPEMVAGLRADGMALPVIFVTGFAGDDAEAGLLDGEHVLRKPFTLAQLDRMIAAATVANDAGPGPAEKDADMGGAKGAGALPGRRAQGIAFSA